MKVYVITMYRFGDENAHSYLYSVEKNETDALEAAEDAEEARGGKYDAQIAEIEIGKPNTRKYIKKIYSQIDDN